MPGATRVPRLQERRQACVIARGPSRATAQMHRLLTSQQICETALVEEVRAGPRAVPLREDPAGLPVHGLEADRALAVMHSLLRGCVGLAHGRVSADRAHGALAAGPRRACRERRRGGASAPTGGRSLRTRARACARLRGSRGGEGGPSAWAVSCSFRVPLSRLPTIRRSDPLANLTKSSW